MGRRQLAELNLLDRFLFNEAMEDPENEDGAGYYF